MPKRPPRKGRGADIFLEKSEQAAVTKRRTPKGQGADVFLGPESASPQSPKKRPPLLAPASMEAALDRVCQVMSPSPGRIDRPHLIVILWLQVTLKEAGA